jgi:hypothetical protein
MTGKAPVPARFDRAALERILQRAAELQASEHDIGEGLSADEIVALGQEVGIPGQLLRRAMLEERSRVAPPAPTGLLDTAVGPAEVEAVRVIRGEQDRIQRTLLAYMQKNELLTVQREQPGWVAWERLSGMQAALRRGMSSFDASRARFMLSRADLVRATITSLEPGWCHVTLGASVREARGSLVGGAALLGSLGLAGSAVLVALNAILPVVMAPVVGGVALGWAVSRRFRPVLERVRLGLERALDHAEGEMIKPSHELPPRGPGLLELLSGEVRRALGGSGSAATKRGPR